MPSPAQRDLKSEIARRFGTPALVVDLDLVERNIARLQAACDTAKVTNRPHIKTHKSPLIAGLQRDAGARGITCQKLGEAEVMAAAGFDDIFISYNLLGDDKIDRLGALLKTTNVSVAADNAVVIEGLARAAKIAGRPLPVLIECDTGRKRAGVETSAEAVELATLVAKTPGLAFKGLMLYPPDEATGPTRRFLAETLAGLAANGLQATTISTGGTPNVARLGEIPGVTEHRAGTYVFNDLMTVAAGAAALEDCALTILSTVVSRGSSTRGILDAGSKTLSSDQGGLEGYGLILEYPEVRIHKLAEEHGFLDLSGSNARPDVGEIVHVIPNHVCVTVNLAHRLIGVRGGAVVEVMPVVARGMVS